MQHINLETFAKGAFSAQVNRELQKVAANIQDPNTDATAKRKISEVIEFKHTAYSRGVFAKGAVEAGKFLAGKEAGMYDMGDVIGL